MGVTSCSSRSLHLGPSSAKPPLCQLAFPLSSQIPRGLTFALSLTFLIPCWVLLPAVDSRSICPFRPQNDRQSILFLMTLLPRQGCGAEMGLQREGDAQGLQTPPPRPSSLLPSLAGQPHLCHFLSASLPSPSSSPPQHTTPSTSKQNSWPRMELCTGLIMESSSKLSSKASAALLGLSKDS